tara:strand:+ start:59 stop:514 length:456 start_codon:yes stop_codon:yes gene_type:complete
MVVERDYASNHELGFAQDPCNLGDKSYVNMYLHHDGYPEWQGVQLANWCKANARQDGTAMAAKLVHDMYYDSCYLYAEPQSIDHNYTYVIWTGADDIWISCYDQYTSKCVFVLTPDKIIEKYKSDMDYTDFEKDTRLTQRFKKIEQLAKTN